MKIKIISRTLAFSIAMLLSLSACSGQYIPLGEYRIEWDEYDPDLHGQAVLFSEPMSYAIFGEEDLKTGWKKEFIEVGRFLQSARADNMTAHKPEPIIDSMLFKIKGSFWIRNDWFMRDLHGDTRYLLMVDENNIESITSFADLFISSNRKDLASKENEGRFNE